MNIFYSGFQHLYKSIINTKTKIYPIQTNNLHNICYNDDDNNKENDDNNDNKQNIYIYEMFMRDGLQSLNIDFSDDIKKDFMNNLLRSNLKNIEFGSIDELDSLWKYIYDYRFDYNLTMLIVDNISLIKSLHNGIISFGLLSSVSEIFAKSKLNKTSNNSFDDMMYQLNVIYNYNSMSYEQYHVRLYLYCSFGYKKNKMNNDYLGKLYNYLVIIKSYIEKHNIHYTKLDIVLCDSSGKLNNTLLEYTLLKIIQIKDINKYISLHLHCNSHFTDYIDIALKYGINKFDSSMLTLGGCLQYDKNGEHNINTIRLVEYLEMLNYNTNLDLYTLKYIENTLLKKILDYEKNNKKLKK